MVVHSLLEDINNWYEVIKKGKDIIIGVSEINY